MVFGRVKKEEYEKVVRGTNELRAKMEKLRLENALLKDQIRALSTLPPNAGSLYIFIQLKMNVTVDEIRKSPKFSSMTNRKISTGLKKLMKRRLIEVSVQDGKERYSVRTPEIQS